MCVCVCVDGAISFLGRGEIDLGVCNNVSKKTKTKKLTFRRKLQKSIITRDQFSRHPTFYYYHPPTIIELPQPFLHPTHILHMPRRPSLKSAAEKKIKHRKKKEEKKNQACGRASITTIICTIGKIPTPILLYLFLLCLKKCTPELDIDYKAAFRQTLAEAVIIVTSMHTEYRLRLFFSFFLPVLCIVCTSMLQPLDWVMTMPLIS